MKGHVWRCLLCRKQLEWWKQFPHSAGKTLQLQLWIKTKLHQHNLKVCLYSTSAGGQRQCISVWPFLTPQGNALPTDGPAFCLFTVNTFFELFNFPCSAKEKKENCTVQNHLYLGVLWESYETRWLHGLTSASRCQLFKLLIMLLLQSWGCKKIRQTKGRDKKDEKVI